MPTLLFQDIKWQQTQDSCFKSSQRVAKIERFGEIPKELSKMLTDMDTQFKTYINATEFKKYEEITKTRIEDNLNGKKLSSNQL